MTKPTNKNRTFAQFQITVNLQQLAVLNQAADLLSRIGMGQIAEIVQYTPNKNAEDRTELRYELGHLQAMATGLENSNAYHRILSTEVPEASRIAYDLHRVFRYTLSLLRESSVERYTVDREPPGDFTATQLPLAQVLSTPTPLAPCEPAKDADGLAKLIELEKSVQELTLRFYHARYALDPEKALEKLETLTPMLSQAVASVKHVVLAMGATDE